MPIVKRFYSGYSLVGATCPVVNALDVFDAKARAPLRVESLQALAQREDGDKGHLLLFFYPYNFTAVCPQELHELNSVTEQLQGKGVKVASVSRDSVFSHMVANHLTAEEGGLDGPVNFSMISDVDGQLIKAFGMMHSVRNQACRGVAFISKDGIVRSVMINDISIRRNIEAVIQDTVEQYLVTIAS